MNPNRAVAFDAYLLWGLTKSCNLHCAYCSVGDRAHLSDNLISINIPIFLQKLKETGLTFCVEFCGSGETFLATNLVEACQEISQDHYVALTSNLTLPSVKNFARLTDPSRVLRISASAHLKELDRQGLLGDYFDNFLLLRSRGFNVLAVAVAYPALLSEIEKYRSIFSDQGIDLRFEAFVGEFGGKKYPQAYTRQELGSFGIDIKPHYRYGKICNAGYNAAVVSAAGELTGCPFNASILGNVYDKINFRTEPIICPFEFCRCPGNDQTSYLLNRTSKQIGWRAKIYLYPRFIKEQFCFIADYSMGQCGIFLRRHFPRLYLGLKKIKLIIAELFSVNF